MKIKAGTICISNASLGKNGYGRGFAASLFFAMCFTLFLSGNAPVVYGAENSNPPSPRLSIKRVSLALNKSRRIKIGRAYSEVVVGNEEIADARPLTNKTIYILGKSIGTTNLSIYDKDKYLIGIIDIEITYDISALRRKLRQSIKTGNLKVSSVNGRVMLSGRVPDAPTLQRAVAIAEQFAPDAVLNSVTIGATQQVMLEVRFVEAFSSASRELGLRWDVMGKRFAGVIGGVGATTAAGPVGAAGLASGLASGSAPFGTTVGRLLSGGTTADSIIQALETKGLARRLAEPNLVALSGDTASFLAGGEFPFPVPAGDGNITIEFKKFGVGLSFTPTVLSSGLIHLKIEPEVSQLDPSNSIRINGIDIPALIVRRTNTTVELRDGQSFAIAGLLQTINTKTGRGLPWVTRMPVLGALFSSRSYQKQQTDLVIIVTPRLVRPAAPGQHLATPLDKTVPANDAEFFLGGKHQLRKTQLPGELLKLVKQAGYARGTYGHLLGF